MSATNFNKFNQNLEQEISELCDTGLKSFINLFKPKVKLKKLPLQNNNANLEAQLLKLEQENQQLKETNKKIGERNSMLNKKVRSLQSIQKTTFKNFNDKKQESKDLKNKIVDLLKTQLEHKNKFKKKINFYKSMIRTMDTKLNNYRKEITKLQIMHKNAMQRAEVFLERYYSKHAQELTEDSDLIHDFLQDEIKFEPPKVSSNYNNNEVISSHP